MNVAVSCLWHGQQAFKVWLLEQISIKHFFFEGSNDFEPGRVWRLHVFVFFLWTAIQIFEHTLLKRCAHAGPTAQARTLPTLLVCVCVCVFFVSLIICLQWRLDLDFYMQIWGLELRSCIILSYDVNSFCGAQGTERMDWWYHNNMYTHSNHVS